MTNINSAVQPDLNWASRLGASGLRIDFPGTRVLGVSNGTGAPASALLASNGEHARPRVPGKVAFTAPLPQRDGVATQLGQPNYDNYMTSVTAVGEGASGPPRGRKPV